MTGLGQKIQGKLRFTPGKYLAVQMQLKATVTQQAMGNAISFDADGEALYGYSVLETTANQTTLQHEGKKIAFAFDGMGQKRSFNSERKADLDGQFGDPVKKILSKKFDLVVDEYGNVITTKPETIEPVKTDEHLSIVLNMISDISDMVYPPQKGTASFFKVLPDNEIAVGDIWSDSIQTGTGNLKTIYTLAGVTDSTILVDFKTSGLTIAKTTMMGRETTTTLNNTGTGNIVIDRATGIIKQKKIVTESGGTMEAMGGSTPVTSKTTLTIFVTPQ